MAQLVIPTTVDTLSTDGNCLYPAAALGGQPIVSPNIKIDGQQVEFYTASTLPATVEGTESQPTHPITLPTWGESYSSNSKHYCIFQQSVASGSRGPSSNGRHC